MVELENGGLYNNMKSFVNYFIGALAVCWLFIFPMANNPYIKYLGTFICAVIITLIIICNKE